MIQFSVIEDSKKFNHVRLMLLYRTFIRFIVTDHSPLPHHRWKTHRGKTPPQKNMLPNK